MPQTSTATLVRHEADAPRERSTCGWRHRLISRQDCGLNIMAWAHAVDIDGAREHYHKVGTEIYYVLDGEGRVKLDGIEHPVCKGLHCAHSTRRRPRRKGTHARARDRYFRHQRG